MFLPKSMTVRFRVVVFSMLLAFGTVGCTGGGGTAPGKISAASGSYTLVTINGSAMPLLTVPEGLNANFCVGFTDSGSLVLSAQSFELKLNAHFVCRDPPINFVTSGQVGTWSEAGGQVSFTAASQNPPLNLSSATLSGSTLTLSLDLPSYAPSGVSAGRATTEWRKQ